MSDPHPSYPRSLITQAFCHLRIEAGSESRAPDPLELLGRVKDAYPHFEPVTQFSIQLPNPGSSVMPVFFGHSPPQLGAPRYRLMSDDRRAVLHVGQTALSVEMNQPYPGWASFGRRVADAWNHFAELTAPIAVVHASARYVNRIPREEGRSQISQLLRTTDMLPAGVIASKGKAYARVEASDVPDEVTIVTFGIEQVTTPSQEYPPLIFDIERRWDGKISPDGNAVTQLLDRLHESVWQVFAAAKTGQLEEYMQGLPS